MGLRPPRTATGSNPPPYSVCAGKRVPFGLCHKAPAPACLPARPPAPSTHTRPTPRHPPFDSPVEVLERSVHLEAAAEGAEEVGRG